MRPRRLDTGEPYPIPKWIRRTSIFNHARRYLGDSALRLAQKANRSRYVTVDYPNSSQHRPRWGYGKPPHRSLARLFASFDSRFREELEALLEFRDELLSINPHYWRSKWLLGLDGASIYAYMRRLKPMNYVEIGSGVSTMFAARARSDGALATTLTSIDPKPRSDIDTLCDTFIRTPLEDCDLSLFGSLERNDILFVDDSHQVFMNSDATTFFLDILPELQDGVVVGIHDVLLPNDYLPEWSGQFWSEQYVLAAFLLAGCDWIEPLLACNYVGEHPDLGHILAPLWSDERMEGVDSRGFVLWLRIRR
ncbi:MAG: class I SAM-dependent methyltransferase [Actinomycetota bacterium]